MSDYFCLGRRRVSACWARLREDLPEDLPEVLHGSPTGTLVSRIAARI